MMVHLTKGEMVDRDNILLKLVDIQYQRNDIAFERGKFRVRGDTIEVWPASEEYALRIELFGDDVEQLAGSFKISLVRVIRKFKVKVVNGNHPITRGVNDFVVTDEQHYMKYEKDPKHLLLRSVNEDGLTYKELGTSSAAGWAYDYGKGRVCYLAPGHMLTVLWNPEYEKLQKNAVRWLMRES